MTQLPPEIHEAIINELAKFTVHATEGTINKARNIGIESNSETAQLWRYASVSRVWQSFIEGHTFRALSFTSKELHCVRTIVGKRWPLVKTIRFEILLPEYDFEACKRRETVEEQQKNSEVFTDAIESLFNEIGDWCPEGSEEYGKVERLLSIGCHSPNDLAWVDDATYRRRSYNSEDIRKRRHAKSYIEFLHHNRLSLRCTRAFTKLECVRHRRRIIDASSLCTLATYMPGLLLFSGDLWDSDAQIERRNELRLEFARNLPKIPQSVRHIWLSYHHERPDNQGQLPYFSPNDIGYDPFSSSMRQISQQLVTLSLSHCVIGMDLFWPTTSDQDQDSTPQWPNLQKVFLFLHPILADGSSLFERDPDHLENSSNNSDPTTENIDRRPKFKFCHRKPVPQLLDRLHLNIALAAENMPKLNRMEMRFMKSGFDPPAHTFTYEEKDGAKKHIAWKTRPWYHPSAEVIDTWKRAKGYDIEIESETLH